MIPFQKIKKAAITIWHIFKPADYDELRIFMLLFSYFSVFTISFCLVAIPKDIPLGMLGYDTVGYLIFEHGQLSPGYILSWNLRHPLYKVFLLPIILLNEGLLSLGIHLTWPIFLTSTTFMMSCCGLFIYKTLRTLDIDIRSSYYLLLLYCSFAHTIMLSIQVDSFVMSMFFCSAMTLLFVTKAHNKLSDNILFLGITGTTSTNFIKFLFYQILEERSCKKTLQRFALSIIFFSCLFAFTIRNLIFRLTEFQNDYLYAIVGDTLSYRGSDLSRWTLFIENYISEPIVFHHTTGILFSNETIHLPSYSSQLLYIPIIIIYTLVLFSIILNRNNQIIHLFCLCFGFDLFMHFGIGYGLEEGQLFCGHWIFFIPIVIGVLLKEYPSAKLIVMSFTIICFILLFLYNITMFCLSL